MEEVVLLHLGGGGGGGTSIPGSFVDEVVNLYLAEGGGIYTWEVVEEVLHQYL